MQKDLSLNNLITNTNPGFILKDFLFSLLLAGVLAYLLSLVYVRCGRSLSNRRQFAHNFLLLTVTTTLVISIVKSSLALSLGLVGALSIVRFRAAIKEPEELAYLFLAISIGLGLGANQTLVTLVAFTVIVGFLIIEHALRRKSLHPNLFLTINAPVPAKMSASQMEEALRQSGLEATLQRLDETPEAIEAAFLVSGAETSRLEEFGRRARQNGEGIRINYVKERSFGE